MADIGLYLLEILSILLILSITLVSVHTSGTYRWCPTAQLNKVQCWLWARGVNKGSTTLGKGENSSFSQLHTK